MADKQQDIDFPQELWLRKVNPHLGIERVIQTVNEYLPVPTFEPIDRSSSYSSY